MVVIVTPKISQRLEHTHNKPEKRRADTPTNIFQNYWNQRRLLMIFKEFDRQNTYLTLYMYL